MAVLIDRQTGKRYAANERLVIGTGPKCDVIIEGEGINPRHAYVSPSSGDRGGHVIGPCGDAQLSYDGIPVSKRKTIGAWYGHFDLQLGKGYKFTLHMDPPGEVSMIRIGLSDHQTGKTHEVSEGWFGIGSSSTESDMNKIVVPEKYGLQAVHAGLQVSRPFMGKLKPHLVRKENADVYYKMGRRRWKELDKDSVWLRKDADIQLGGTLPGTKPEQPGYSLSLRFINPQRGNPSEEKA